MLKLLSGPDRPRANCRMCDLIPREVGGLYCALCRRDVYTLASMAWKGQHPLGCFCVACQCEDQRIFRHRQAHAKRTAERYGIQPPEPEPPSIPPVGPRAA